MRELRNAIHTVVRHGNNGIGWIWFVIDCDQPVERGHADLWMKAQQDAHRAQKEYKRQIAEAEHRNKIS